MSKFTGQLSVNYHDNIYGQLAILNEPLVWECDEKGSGLTVTIPAGYVSDGATVPRIFWWFMPPWGHRGTRAALVHDYLLEMLVDKRTPVAGIDTRSKCDWQFFLALKALGVPDWRARLTFWGVTAFTALWSVSRQLSSWFPAIPALR
jgi:hypothetical protein